MGEDGSKINKGKEKWKKKQNVKGACKNSKIKKETSNNGASYNKKFKKKVDTKEVQCYNILVTMLGYYFYIKN